MQAIKIIYYKHCKNKNTTINYKSAIKYCNKMLIGSVHFLFSL
jgi:hypothetical protein